MKHFTKFFTLIVAFTMLFSVSLNAQPTWTTATIDGDSGHPLLEIWVYGVSPSWCDVGDIIGAFDGGKLVGRLTLTDVPSLANWSNFQLIAYSQNTSGDVLYTPGNPILLKFYNISNGRTSYASGWGDNEPIDFYNDWYAPTSEALTGTTTGAYFPPEGRSSYCYVDLDFVWDDPANPMPTYGKVIVSVFDDDSIKITAADGATVFTDGYDGVEQANPNEGIFDLYVFAGSDDPGTDLYTYTVTVDDGGAHATETFDIALYASVPQSKNIYLDGEGGLAGFAKIYDLETPGYIVKENILVSATICGTTYSDLTDESGYYLIEDIPDGERAFAYSYNGYVTQNIDRDIPYNGNTLTLNLVDAVKLDLKTGTLTGEVYDAVTMDLIDAHYILKELDGTTAYENDAADGVYIISHYGGTYNLVFSLGTYETLTINNIVISPDNIIEKNYTLLPTANTTPEFAAITGNPNKMWTIQIEMAKFGANYCLPWDELVIFDKGQAGNVDEPGLRVGTIRLPDVADWQNSGTNVMKVFAEFSNGNAGYGWGNEMEIWAYDISSGEVYETPIDWWFNPNAGTYSGTTFPDPELNEVSYLNIYWGTVPGELEGTVYETAANGGGTINGVKVEVLNIFTQDVVKTETTVGGGLYTFSLDEGIYDIRFSKIGYSTVLNENIEIFQDQTTEHDTILTKLISANIEYNLPSPGFYFIGRSVVKASDETDMLILLDNAANGYAKFSEKYFDSWVLNDDGSKLENTNSNPTSLTWLPAGYHWELLEGYQVYRTIHYKFFVEGYLVQPENNPITFASDGIYYVPYFPYDNNNQDDALTAFASILDNLDWVMDSEGNKLHKNTGSWVDNIGELSLKEGYKVKMNGADILTYPSTSSKSITHKTTLDPVHFVYNSGNAGNWTYTIFVNTAEFDIGDEIAALSNGNIVGSMVINSYNPWENDLNTFRIAVNGGYDINSAIELIAWDQSENKEYNTNFSMVNVNNQCYFGVNYPAGLDHFSFANVFRGTVTIEENQIDNTVSIYPNPASNLVNIHSRNNIKEIAIYNLLGNRIYSSDVDNDFITINTSNFSPGVYIIQLNYGNGIINKKLSIQ